MSQHLGTSHSAWAIGRSLAALVALLAVSLLAARAEDPVAPRPDGAVRIYAPSGPASAQNPAFSPDGQRIVFDSDAGLKQENPWVVAATGGAPVRVTTSEATDGAPSWSPDGAWIAFESHPSDSAPAGIWRIRVPHPSAGGGGGSESGGGSRGRAEAGEKPKAAGGRRAGGNLPAPPPPPPPTPDPVAPPQHLGLPPDGRLYHGVFLGGPGTDGEEDGVTAADLAAYETAVGKRVAWVYFSNNWYKSREFPRAKAEWIRTSGAVPFIRLMLRSDSVEGHADPVFTTDAICAGAFDADLTRWAEGARKFGAPLLVEYGTEVNYRGFPWNGSWNGAGRRDGFGDPQRPDGPERFVAAYRRIVRLMRAAGALNITWVFHVNNDDLPAEPWNRLEEYYPGDDVVDWVAFSAYGAQSPMDADFSSFRDGAAGCYERLRQLAPAKPLIVAEFGSAARNPVAASERWAHAALLDLLGGHFPRVIGFSWWDEHWQNDDDPQHDTTMRVEEIPALARVFREDLLAGSAKVAERPVLQQGGASSDAAGRPESGR